MIVNVQKIPTVSIQAQGLTGSQGLSNINDTTFTSVTRINIYAVCTAINAGTDTLVVNIQWRGIGANILYSTSPAITLSNSNGTIYTTAQIIIYHNGFGFGNIQWSTTVVGASGDTYAVYITIEKMP